MDSTRLYSLEKRVEALEKCMAQVMQNQTSQIVWKDWRDAIGKFNRTEISEEVDAAAREIREADRREARQ